VIHGRLINKFSAANKAAFPIRQDEIFSVVVTYSVDEMRRMLETQEGRDFIEELIKNGKLEQKENPCQQQSN